jgi:hypothetical protein
MGKWFPGALQGIGALAITFGLFAVLSPGLALAIVGALVLVGGTVLEVGARPRRVLAPTSDEIASRRRAAVLDDYRNTASER